MEFNLKPLEVFVTVARLGSFTRAAQALYLTQSTVSAHIQALERALGGPLFQRTTRRQICLTWQGETALPIAREILDHCQALQSLSGPGGEGETLDLAASTVPAQYLLPQALPALRQRYPPVFFQVRQGDSSQVIQWMTENGAELGIVGAPAQRPGLLCVPFLTERLVIAAPNTPPYQRLEGNLTPQLLRTLPFLVREPGSGTRKQADQFLRSLELEPQALNLAAQLESTESILQGVKYGLGVSIVSQYAAREEAAAGRILLFHWDSPLLERQFYLLYRRSAALSPAAAMLLQELPSFYQNLG